MECISVYESKKRLRKELLYLWSGWVGWRLFYWNVWRYEGKEAQPIINISLYYYVDSMHVYICVVCLCGGHRVSNCVCPQTVPIFSIWERQGLLTCLTQRTAGFFLSLPPQSLDYKSLPPHLAVLKHWTWGSNSCFVWSTLIDVAVFPALVSWMAKLECGCEQQSSTERG